jgi:uncharacterized protein (TIGR03118 family)
MTFRAALLSASLLSVSLAAFALPAEASYSIRNLVANKQVYMPEIVDPHFKNSWGIAIRPAGKGGHFWINNTDNGTVDLFVGDVGSNKLHQDDTKSVVIAPAKGEKENAAPTGQVFNGRDDEFIVTHEGLTGPSKFIFCTEGGTISGWTEKQNDDGSFQRPKASALMVDNSKKKAIYKGLAVSEGLAANRLYAADFGRSRIDVFDAAFKPASLGKEAFKITDSSVPKNYAPFNIQFLGGKLYVAYAELGKEAGEEVQGEGKGYVSEFDADGKFLRTFEGKGHLNAPWGLAIAPKNFGEHSERLLVGNFGDGRIVAFDLASGKQLDVLKRGDGQPVEIQGLWGIVFGNGESLGEANHLYYAAGPADEADGVFGKILPQ